MAHDQSMKKAANATRLIKTHSFVFNQKNNENEALTLVTKFYFDQGKHHSAHELRLMANNGIASFNLSGELITPEILRKLADSLEGVENEVVKKS